MSGNKNLLTSDERTWLVYHGIDFIYEVAEHMGIRERDLNEALLGDNDIIEIVAKAITAIRK